MTEDHCTRVLSLLEQLYPKQSLPSGFLKKLQEYADKRKDKSSVTATLDDSVYDSTQAVITFLTHATNDTLYEVVASVLAKEANAIEERSRDSSGLLPTAVGAIDIGSGPGVLLAKVIKRLNESRRIEWTVLEPAAELLQENTKVLSRGGVKATPLNVSLQTFVDNAGSADGGKVYAIGLMTFALSAIPKAERRSVLDKLAQSVKSLLIVDFNCDVPGMACTSGSGLFAEERVRAIADLYSSAYPSYVEDEEILEKFLLPAFFGYFDESSKRVTYEQSLDDWCQEFQQLEQYTAAVVAPALGSFWWGKAFCIRLDAVVTNTPKATK